LNAKLNQKKYSAYSLSVKVRLLIQSTSLNNQRSPALGEAIRPYVTCRHRSSGYGCQRIYTISSTSAEIGANVSVISLSGSTGTNLSKFLPGQWLNLHLDGLEVLRGYGIISVLDAALAAQGIALGSKPHVKVIIQNAPTIQIQQPRAEVSLRVGTQLNILFGGSFVWPPNSVHTTPITRVVSLAGGVGVR
jgi:hypothetical protein